jgi:hypothetical protein
MNQDGISYLDMADKLLQWDFSPLIHPYWSPLYPCLLAFVLKAFPGPGMEFQAAHIANWLIGLAALASFTFFLTQHLRLQAAANGPESAAGFRSRTGFAYMLFLWGTLEAIGLAVVTPDLCVTALVYLIAGLCCKLIAGRPGWHMTAGLLGIMLGFAGLTKAAMMPLGAALLVLLAIPWFPVPARRPSLAIAVLGFLIISGPFVFALSLRQHHLTFGEAGRLNYAWAVQRGIPIHAMWLRQGPTGGTPVHPPRVLNSDPLVLEFTNTVPGTNPLWYDPSYFYEGLQVHFDLRKQVSAMVKSLQALRWASGSMLYPLLAGLFVLGCHASRRRVWKKLSRSLLLVWSLLAIGMFAQVAVEPRYVAPFLVLFWLAIYDAFSPSRLRAVYRGAINVTAVCILLFQMHPLLKTAAEAMRASGSPVHLAVARELARLGLHAGDEIATVGSGFEAYYARLARLRIVAYIGWTDDRISGDDPSPPLNDAQVATIQDKLRQLHIKAIVGPANRVVTVSGAWHPIGDTGYCVLFTDGTPNQ